MIEVALLIVILMFKFGRDLSGLSYDWLDRALIGLESRMRMVGWTLLLSLLLIALATVYARIAVECTYLGRHYAALAENPFALGSSNPVSYRILTPLISYLIGLRGQGIIITNLLISVVMVACVYMYFRKTAPRPGDAFLMSTVITFSLVVLTSIHCGGYCDIMSYLLIFLMWWFRKHRTLFYLMFLAGLLNRESVLFLLPWFIVISLDSDRPWYLRIVEMIFGFGITILVYYLFRQWVTSGAEIKYSLSYYLEPFVTNPLQRLKRTVYYHSLGLFSVYKVLWVFPCVAALSWWRNRKYASLANVLILLLCAWAQLFLAIDTSRMFTLGFMVMIVAVDDLLKTDFMHFRRWAFWAVLFNLMIPQVYTAGKVVEVWQTLTTHISL
ncbi:MAG: hypothetical protein JSV52_06490 [Candidatus Zixiibacteriota bacterium]|nr:MAG: hypothetical protein JSV52_06490 [candidate division Zixibacteria bacterium]